MAEKIVLVYESGGLEVKRSLYLEKNQIYSTFFSSFIAFLLPYSRVVGEDVSDTRWIKENELFTYCGGALSDQICGIMHEHEKIMNVVEGIFLGSLMTSFSSKIDYGNILMEFSKSCFGYFLRSLAVLKKYLEFITWLKLSKNYIQTLNV